MDFMFIRALKIPTIIGTHVWERQMQQTVVLDLEIAIDATMVAQKNDLAAGIDYSSVAETVSEFVKNSDFLLLESLAQAIAELILERFKTPRIKLSLAKPGAIPNTQAVGVVIERTLK